jgi:hypothetical protein
MADLALDCPYAFNKKYVAKEKVVEAEAPSATIGKAVHSILELSLKGAPVDKAYGHVLEAVELPYELQLQVHTFRDAVKEFVDGIEVFRKKFGIIQMHTECKVSLTPEFKLTTFFDPKGLIRGVIDLVFFTSQRSAVIIDHKTGAVKPIDKYQGQTRVYSLFADALMDRVKSVRMAYHYVGADPNEKGTRTVWEPEYPIEMVRSVFRQELVEYLQRAAQSALTAEPRKCWRCGFCGYKPVCPIMTP